MLAGQFYKKQPTDDALPWEYYGKLANEHGGILRQMISSAKSGARGLNGSSPQTSPNSSLRSTRPARAA